MGESGVVGIHVMVDNCVLGTCEEILHRDADPGLVDDGRLHNVCIRGPGMPAPAARSRLVWGFGGRIVRNCGNGPVYGLEAQGYQGVGQGTL